MSDEIVKIQNEDLGYDPFFESSRRQMNLTGFSVARVIAEHRGSYKVKNANGEFSAKITGKQMFAASKREDYPAVGDWVAITELPGNQAVINAVLPRKTIIKRKSGDKNRVGEKSEAQVIATNIDVAFIVESVGRDYNLNRFERYFAIANDEGIVPVIILNKTDLNPKEELDAKLAEIKNRFPDIDVVLTSTISNEGLDDLKAHISKRKTHCFLGSSGVGKSSLINALLGNNTIKTGEISEGSGRGKHSTTSREMYFLDNGGIVIDNPGMREVGVTDTTPDIDNFFDEIIALSNSCKYADCAHVNEPGCEVLSALKSGKLDENRYLNFMSLKKEAEYNEMSDYEKNEKDRRFGKFINKAKKDFKKFGHKDF